MIIDRLEAAPRYYSAIPGLKEAIGFIAAHTDPWEVGRYDFDGGYLMYQENETKDPNDGTFESHNVYIDVQISIDCDEWYSLWNCRNYMTEVIPYNSERDCTRYEGEGSWLQLKSGMFVVFFPEDAHKPDRHLPGSQSVPYHKIVIKLPVQQVKDENCKCKLDTRMNKNTSA